MTPLKILAVEHDLSLLDLYDALLSQRGHRVIQTRTGPEGIPHLADAIDVVIVDIRSAKSIGHKMLEAIHEEGPRDAVPVLLVDGNSAASGLVNGPHTMTLHKPFAFERFVEAVESLAATGRRRGQN
jgi:DNA-binding NtrC family response regulator